MQKPARTDRSVYVSAEPVESQCANTGPVKCQYASTGPVNCQCASTGPVKCQYASTGPVNCQCASTGPVKCQYASTGPVNCQCASTGPVKCQCASTEPVKNQQKKCITVPKNGSDTQEIQLMASNCTDVNRQTPPVPIGDAVTTGNKKFILRAKNTPKITITFYNMKNSAIIVHHSSNFKDIFSNPVCVYTASRQLPTNTSILQQNRHNIEKTEIHHLDYVRTVQINHQFQLSGITLLQSRWWSLIVEKTMRFTVTSNLPRYYGNLH